MPVKGTPIQQAILGALCPLKTTTFHLQMQHFVQSALCVHTSTQSCTWAQVLCQGRLVVACKAWKHLSMSLSKGMPEAVYEQSTLWVEEVIQVNGFHSPPGKPFFCPLEPPKGMFAHQPSYSHGSDPPTALHFHGNPSPCNREWPKIARLPGLERVAKEWEHQGWTLAWGGGLQVTTV